jgi:superfamily I DNA/RNA helicase
MIHNTLPEVLPGQYVKLPSCLSTFMILYRTAKLWIKYMEMVAILRSLIRSARTGNWKLYRQSLHEMFPYLAASGHNNDVKSLMLYLQRMEKLDETPRCVCEIHGRTVCSLAQ